MKCQISFDVLLSKSNSRVTTKAAFAASSNFRESISTNFFNNNIQNTRTDELQHAPSSKPHGPSSNQQSLLSTASKMVSEAQAEKQRADSEREAARLWRAFRTTLQMVRDRVRMGCSQSEQTCDSDLYQ